MCLNDLATLQLTIVGILVSVATLLFATIVSKREEYRAIRKSTDFDLKNRAVEVRNDIHKLKRYGLRLVWITVVLFVLYMFSTIANSIVDDGYLYVPTIILIILTLGLLVWITCLSIQILRYFNNIDE